jgi:hypothetical protein
VSAAEALIVVRLPKGADAFDATLGRLLDTAAIPGDRPVIRGLLDLGTWDSLRRQGLTAEEAVAAVTALLRQRSAAH